MSLIERAELLRATIERLRENPDHPHDVPADVAAAAYRFLWLEATTTPGAVEVRDEALKLLDEFDRYASTDPEYMGSPFSKRIAKFLTVHGGQ